MDLAFASANARRGERLRVAGRDITFVAPEDARLADSALVFSALPHGASAEWIQRAEAAGARAVDLSADLRPGNTTRSVPYGLTEAARAEVRGASVIANPGCYPTAILLGLLPLLERGLVRPGAMINVVAASGVTGAGFTPKPELLFAEIAEDYRAYAVGNEHRHLAEMRAMLARYSADADLLFTPHLLPVARGILATITVPLTEPLANPLALWNERYAGEPFIEIADAPPALRDVVRRNVARVWATPAANVREPTLIIVAAIDNLVKGAAGQAVQNANLALGLEETVGLPA
jgi:N-acetyl-gamma-glutamyl-phosphate reductase